MSIDDLIGPILTALFVIALAAEALVPRDAMPARRFWRLKGLLFFVVIAAVNSVLPLLLPLPWIAAHSLLPGHRLGVGGGFVVGWLANGAIYYGWHRLQHHSALLWRLTHQLHHSAPRVDVAGFAYAHPLDVAAQSTLSLVVTIGLLGLQPEAASLIGLVTAVVSLAQHLNLRTPLWLEWFMQRPEAHLRHHEYGVHAGNYADWPVWDKLFGTYRAPPTAPLRYGFDVAAERRWGAMLLGVDVNPGRAPMQRDDASTDGFPRRPSRPPQR